MRRLVVAAEIDIEQLERIFHVRCKHLKDQGIHSIDIDHDYYWNIPKEELYEMSQEPKSLDIGQLSEDLGFLRRYLDKSAQPIGFGFVWMSSILRLLGDEHMS